MTDKKYIINKTKSILIVQGNKKETICILQPLSVSYEAYDTDVLNYCYHIQHLLRSKCIELSDTNNISFNELGKDYGQNRKIGEFYTLKGDKHIKIQILAYSPNSGKYKARVVKSGGIMTLSEKEIVDLVEDEIETTLQQPVEIVTNEEGLEEDIENLSGEEALRALEANARRSIEDVEVIVKDKEGRAAEEDDFDEQLIIRKNDQHFADEVPLNRVAEDTSKEVTQKLKKVVEKAIPQTPSKENTIIDGNIPEELQNWFSTFSAKDERRKKMTISACNDVNKLEIVKQFGDPLSQKLASVKLGKITNEK